MTEVSSGRARHGRPRRWQALRRQRLRWPAPEAEPRWPAARATPRRPARPVYGVISRVAGAIAIGVAAVLISGWSPGVVGVLGGVLTWLLLIARHALSRRRSS